MILVSYKRYSTVRCAAAAPPRRPRTALVQLNAAYTYVCRALCTQINMHYVLDHCLLSLIIDFQLYVLYCVLLNSGIGNLYGGVKESLQFYNQKNNFFKKLCIRIPKNQIVDLQNFTRHFIKKIRSR